MSESIAVVEIKKERLARHLNQVEGHLAQWLGEIDTPRPFSQIDLNPEDIHIAPYQPPLEKDPDINHMLRKHLNSRVLWRRHSDWMLLQESLAKAGNRLVKLGQVKLDKLAQEEGVQPTLWFLNSALEDAFAAVAGRVDLTAQPESDPYGGVIYRSSQIETEALPEDLEKVTRALKQLTNMLGKLPEMAVLSGLWTEIKEHEESMAKIGGVASAGSCSSNLAAALEARSFDGRIA